MLDYISIVYYYSNYSICLSFQYFYYFIIILVLLFLFFISISILNFPRAYYGPLQKMCVCPSCFLLWLPLQRAIG